MSRIEISARIRFTTQAPSCPCGSPGARIGFVPDDVIAEIDGRPVHNNHDIESAIAANARGLIKVAYLIKIKGMGLTEREVTVRCAESPASA
jgi:S1-C subfamily serine protease